MKIDYVIISSDDNPMYKDFYPIVAKRWNQLGFKTYYVNITTENYISEDEYGIVHKIKDTGHGSTGFQSQIVRLFTSKFIDGVILTSDIDMLPINGSYFNQYLDELSDDNVIIYSGQPYGTVPYYPMCYVLSHTSNFKKYLEIDDLDFTQYCKQLLEKYGEAWNTDEHFMYDKFENHKEKLIIKSRDFSRRVDRGNWNYNKYQLEKGFYIDSHLLRPYNQYKNLIDQLLYEIK